MIDPFHQSSLSDTIRRPVLLGIWLVVCFLGGMGTWTATTSIESAIIAPAMMESSAVDAVVKAENEGNFRALAVPLHTIVQQGSVLSVLDNPILFNQIDSVERDLFYMKSRAARYISLRDNLSSVKFPPVPHPGFEGLLITQREEMEAEKMLFEASLENLFVQERNALEEVERLNKEIASLEQTRNLASQASSTGEDFRESINRRNRLILEATAMRETSAKFRDERLRLQAKRISDASLFLSNILPKIAEQESILRKLKSDASKLTLRAPISGKINAVRVQPGDHVMPGDSVIDILVLANRFFVQARVPVKDIRDVLPGLKARVVFPTLRSSGLITIEGKVESVATAFSIEETTGSKYHRVIIDIDESARKAMIKGIHLRPGLYAESYIMLGKDTILGYLVRPLLLGLERTMRER